MCDFRYVRKFSGLYYPSLFTALFLLNPRFAYSVCPPICVRFQKCQNAAGAGQRGSEAGKAHIQYGFNIQYNVGLTTDVRGRQA